MATPLALVYWQMKADLESVGVHLKHPTGVAALENLPKAAVPVLIGWIDWIGTVDVPDGDRWYLWDTVAKGLDTRQARPVAGPPLVRLFRDPRLPMAYKWTVGCALYRVADASLLDDLIAISRDRSFADARQMVVESLGRLGKGARREEVIDVLIDVLDDGDESVSAFAISALAKLNATRAVDQIARHLDSPVPIAKRTARNAIAKLGARDAGR